MKFKGCDFFLYMGSLLLIIKTIFSVSKIIPYTEFADQILSVSGALFLLTTVLLQRYKLKILLLYTIIVCLTLYNSYITGNNALAITVISCLAVRNSSIESYISLVCKVECFFLVMHTLLAIGCSILGGIEITQCIGGVSRYDFGMQHPNSFAALVFNILIMLIWLKWDKIKVRHIILMILVIFVLYAFCKTRTNLITMLIVISMLFFQKYVKKSDRIIEKIAIISIPIFSILMATFILLYKTGNNIILMINSILNARISLGAYAFEHYHFTIFGQRYILIPHGILFGN